MLCASFFINARKLKESLTRVSYMYRDLEFLAQRMHKLIWASRLLIGLCVVSLAMLWITTFYHGCTYDVTMISGLIFIAVDFVSMVLWLEDSSKANDAIEKLSRQPALF